MYYILHLLSDIYLLYYYILHFKEICYFFFFFFFVLNCWPQSGSIVLSNILIALKIVSRIIEGTGIHVFSSNYRAFLGGISV
jgi:hypothetical protein